MRWSLWLLLLALALPAAPAPAQSPGIVPMPEAPAPNKKPAAKPTTKRAPAPPTTGKPGVVNDAAEHKNEGEQKAPAKIEPAKIEPAKIAPAKPAPGKSAAPRLDAAADVFAGIAADERLAIEAALMWSGDYGAAVTGEDPMLTAIKNFQKRSKAKITGTLTPAERASLVAAARERERDFGWSVVADPATGMRIGLPLKLVPQARDAARGTRWSSAHGEMQVETFRIKNADGLAALFEQEKKQPATRRVESSALHAGDFVVRGMQGLKYFSVRAWLRDGEVRGVTVLYDQAMEGIVAPVLGAMASAFTPFPERSAPFAAPAKAVEYGTGLVISGQGHVVTDRKLTQGCRVIVAAGLGDADRLADDPDSGLALLRVYGARKIAPMPLSNAVPKAGEVTLIGIPDPKEQEGRKALTEIKARLTDNNAIELREPVPMAGFSGAAALDSGGQFLGMAEMRNAVLASAQPAPPPLRLIPAQTIRAFLEARDVAAVTAQSGDARAAVVRIICVRK
jgi:hypothetical protein